MTRDGIDKYIASYPGKIDKVNVYRQLNQILADSKVMRRIEEAGEKMQRPARAVIKEDAMDVTR
jgi:hypothetical protein